MNIIILPDVNIDSSWSIQRVSDEATPEGWEELFKDKAKHDIAKVSRILERLKSRGDTFFPSNDKVFNAYYLTPLDRVKVVIFGQDPYHQTFMGVSRAQGLSFSVDRRDNIPVSLRNIYTELRKSVDGFIEPNHGDLTYWAQQGVLLLNACLTVRPNEAGSHGKIWMGLITKTIRMIQEHRPYTIFMLWGRDAQNLSNEIGGKIKILTAAHPSGFSAYKGFFGCNHFNLANEHLMDHNMEPIDWQL